MFRCVSDERGLPRFRIYQANRPVITTTRPDGIPLPYRPYGPLGPAAVKVINPMPPPATITRRVYNLALDEFIEWYGLEPRPGFTKATVNAWRSVLEARGLGSVSINVRITAVRKLAVEAATNTALDVHVVCCRRQKGPSTVGR